MNHLIDELKSFLDLENLIFTAESASELDLLLLPEQGLALVGVPLETAVHHAEDLPRILLEIRENCRNRGLSDVLFLHEDVWRAKGPLVRSRLAVRTGRGKRIFARNCDVRTVPRETAVPFLEANHIYGATGARCNLGLYRNRATGTRESPMMETSNLIAVASFSAFRTIGSVSSCEWERYASLHGTQVIGGMGKILNRFVELASADPQLTRPFEVMSYADSDWSGGNVYEELQFERIGMRDPVPFLVDPVSFRRIHEMKLKKDRRFRDTSCDRFLRIYNCGSLKYSRSFL